MVISISISMNVRIYEGKKAVRHLNESATFRLIVTYGIHV